MAQYAYDACRLLLLACCVTVGSTACAGAAPASEARQPGIGARFAARLAGLLSAQCLTPEAGRVLTEHIAAGGLQGVLPSDYTLVRGDIRGDRIELEIRDDAGQAYGIMLVLAGSHAGTPDGEGRNFRFYLEPSPQPPSERARTTLLALAALFDATIPDSALQSCAGPDAPRAERRYPRSLILASAAVEILIIVTATVFGLRTVRRRT